MAFKDKVVLITGAANGIGKGVASLFAQKGANVIIVDLDKTKGQEITKNLAGAIFIEADVSKEADVKRVLSTIHDRYGRVDVVINNAGISQFTPIFELEMAQWDKVLATNLRSVFMVSREGARMMMNNGGGVIINISSTRAFQSEPHSESYAAAKGGIIALTHALSASLSPYRIRVNSISPGWIQTTDYDSLRQQDHDQHFSKRVGKPSDIAQACLFLCDDNNDFINGTNLVIDGGMTKKMIYQD